MVFIKSADLTTCGRPLTGACDMTTARQMRVVVRVKSTAASDSTAHLSVSEQRNDFYLQINNTSLSHLLFSNIFELFSEYLIISFCFSHFTYLA